jgi:hypothetical protein
MSDKKGVSLIVSYVLLVAVGLAMASLVYGWLRFYVSPQEEIECENGVSLIIKDYDYQCGSRFLNLSIQNKGLFDVQGFIIRTNQDPESGIGVWEINNTMTEVKIGQTITSEYPNLENPVGFIEVQPVMVINGREILCSNVATQKIIC